jgi:hypothetical protein
MVTTHFSCPNDLKLTTSEWDHAGGIFKVKCTIVLTVLSVATLAILLAGCGNPAIGTLQSITLTSSSGILELQGEGGTIQLVAMGNYSSQTSKNLNTYVTYTATPTGTALGGASLPTTSTSNPQTISISATGLVTAIAPFVCTYHNAGTEAQPSYVLTGSYEITATASKVTSPPIYVGVASAAGDGPGDVCGPTPTS